MPYVEEALRWLPDDVRAGSDSRPELPIRRDVLPVPHPGVGGEDDRPRVLVADDNADMRQYVVRLLAEHYRTEAVPDGEAALAAARDRPPDLILTDVMMPRLDGFGLLRELRADPRTRNVPVIMLSARAGEESRVEGMEAGADDYLLKPFSARELQARVTAHLQMARMRRDASEALRQSHSRFEALFDAAPLGVYLVDADLRIRQVNPKARPAFGDIEGLIGSDFVEVIHVLWSQEYADEIVERFRHTLATGEPYFVAERIEERLDRKAVEYYEWQLHRLTLPDGKYGVVCYFNDISRHVLTRLALAEADRRKDEFLATLAHELRNPLAPLRNGLQVMKLAKNNAEAVERSRAMMERQLAQMIRLIDDLLDVSRISQGKIELKRERVDLAKVVQQAVENSRPLIEQGGHDLVVDVSPDPIYVDADVTRLAQVYSNILNNAAKYTEPGGRIRLTVERKESDAVVTIGDNGVGIAAHMLPQVFELFTQVDRSLEKSQGGLGIGLSLVKGLVEMHGGSVEARSDGHGTGSEFVVRVPVVLSVVGELRDEGGGEAIEPGDRRRILVVDDNRDGAESLGMMLTLMGNELRTAHDGLEALDVAAAFRPDLILLDIGMPRLNGYDTARRIREQPWGKNTVLVALTGWGQEDDRQKSHDAGFDTHMVKPVDLAALEKLLANLKADTA
jgi:PAS domain S-box-containing protein